MAKKKKEQVGVGFPLGKSNVMILSLGVAMLVLAYVFMAMPEDPDHFLSRTLAPVLLVISFLIVIPYGIMKKRN